MSMSPHDPEPWEWGWPAGSAEGFPRDFPILSGGRRIGSTDRLDRPGDSNYAHANAVRIVECVNACKSIENPLKVIPKLLNKNGKEETIARLKECVENSDTEAAHSDADAALLNYINDEEISDAWLAVKRWYA